MRKYLIVIAILLVVGVGASFYLIPTEQQVGQMRQKDDAVRGSGYTDYKAEFAKGDRSPQTLIGATTDLIKEGRAAEVLPLLEAHVQTNPDDLDARKKLAEIYQATGRDADYLREIEYVAQKDPSAANLKLLADMYNYVQMYDKQAATLRKLIDVTGGNQPEYYVDLASILMIEEDKAGSAAVLQELRTKHPDYVSYGLTRLTVANLIDTGQSDAAYTEAAKWTSAKPNAVELADLANIINYGGRPDLALQLIEPQKSYVTSDPTLLAAYVNASILSGKSDQAYDILKQVHAAGTLPAGLYHPLIDLALQKQEHDVAASAVATLDTTKFYEDDAINLIELARASNDQDIMNQIINRFNQSPFIDNKPALSAIIAIARRDADEDARIKTAIAANLTRTQRLRLAQACGRVEKKACFDTLVAKFPDYKDMSPREIDEVAMLYIGVNRQSEIYDKVSEQSATRPSEIIDLAKMKIAASLGKREDVSNWLAQNAKNISTGKLTDLFFMANDRGHGTVAMDIAQVLYEREPNDSHRDYLVSGYMRAKEYGKALPLLRESAASSRSAEDNYLAALTQLGKADPTYRTELEKYITPQLESSNVDSARKLQLVFMLINTGNKEKALPYINQYAKSEGGQWRTLYNQVHAVPGKSAGGKAVASSKPAQPPITDMPRDFRMALARDPKTSNETRKMLAFSLIDDGFKTDAAEIFKMLAENKPAQSQEVKDLLYMWGPRLNQEQIAWLIHRANSASTAGEKVQWGEYISNYGDDYALMHYVTANPSALAHPAIRKKYLNALATNATADAFDQGMRGWLNATNDVEALRDYASVAQSYGYTKAAIAALEKIKTLNPNDEQALKDLGILNFGRGKYSESEKYLDAYMNERSRTTQPATEPFDALFYKAELARKNGNKALAAQYLNEIMRLGPSMANTLSRQSMYYTAQFHLGYHKEGMAGFNGLLQHYPNNKSLLADYMSILMEYGYHQEAMAAANQYDPNAASHRAAPVAVQSPDIQSIESFEQGRELKINFNRPLDAMPTTLASANREWIEKTEKGYDSVLIAAKPGYTLKFTPTSQDTVAVVPTGQALTADEQLKRQQDLRLQILYARLELETGQQAQAMQRLNYLRQYFPRDSQLLSYSANVENYAGNWPQALTLLDAAQHSAPDNEDIAAMRQNIGKLHSQYVKADYEYRRIGDSDEHIASVNGVARLTNNVEVGATFQNDEMSTAKTRRASDGRIADYDYSKQRGEVYAAYYFGSGDRLQASLFANNDTAGAGVYYNFSNPIGRSEVLAEYHRPYWDFVEAVAEDATRDRVGVKHVANLTPTTSLSAEASANRYNISTEDNAAETALIRANLVQQIRASNPYVGVGYGFDGEYVLDKTYKPLPGGDKYSPFPMNSREVHFLSGIVSQQLTNSTKADVVGGYAVDRLGGDGPQVEARITQDLGDDVEAQVRARYGFQTRDTNQNATSVGGHLKYKF